MRTKTNDDNKIQTALAGQASEQQNGVKGKIPTQMSEVAAAARSLARFVTPAELETLGNACRGEEGEFFKSKLVEMAGIVNSMPVTYETDGQGDQAVAYLHYFTSDCDFYITERDSEEEQLQAFGLTYVWEEELGYISIAELVDAGAELDLYWTPKTLGQVRAERLLANTNYVGHPMHY